MDALEDLYRIEHIVNMLRSIHHVNAVRLRSWRLNKAPARYTRAVIGRLGDLNRLTVVNPLRLEIETWFLHASDILPEHAVLVEKLRNKGITVYANTALLATVNDTPDEINRIAYGLRRSGIEFHHLFVAGLPLQERWGRSRPVNVADVIDIAGKVRKEGSGREIPRYIIRTALGEVDFGLTSEMTADNGRIFLRLSPYDLRYYREMDPGFEWPDGVFVDDAGKPTVHVPGLTDTDGFMVKHHR